MARARLTVNADGLIVCTEHGDETRYRDRSHVATGLAGVWECTRPGCEAFRIYDRPAPAGRRGSTA